MNIKLQATKRSVTGKGVQALREEGKIPAVVYGAGEDALPIEVSAKEFAKVLTQAGESSVVDLEFGDETKHALIHDVDIDPLSHTPRHADFYVVKKGQKVEVDIPLKFIGESPAVKAGANLIKVMHELTIEGDATALPQSIDVDVATLERIDDQITAGMISLPAGITLITGREEVVVLVAGEQVEEAQNEGGAPDMSAIGISEERGKKDTEAGE